MKKDMFLFLTGGTIYPTLEIAARGRTDFSMAVAGGLCLCLIDRICNNKIKDEPIYIRCVAGSGIITGVEFIIGIVVNMVLKLNVWDYSSMPLNILGQICLPFSLLWFAATIPAMGLCQLCDRSKFLSKGT
jgi:Predicted membrane protein